MGVAVVGGAIVVGVPPSVTMGVGDVSGVVGISPGDDSVVGIPPGVALGGSDVAGVFGISPGVGIHGVIGNSVVAARFDGVGSAILFDNVCAVGCSVGVVVGHCVGEMAM